MTAEKKIFWEKCYCILNYMTVGKASRFNYSNVWKTNHRMFILPYGMLFYIQFVH